MMVFVSRDSDGKVDGVYAYSCDGVAEEELPEDSSDVVAFLNPPPSVPAASRRQFFQQAAIFGIITQDEALAAVTTGALPASVLAFIGTLPADQQFGAKMLFSVNEFERASPMANAFGQMIGMTPGQIDSFFLAASKL